MTPGSDEPGLTMAGLFASMENYLDTTVSGWLLANEAVSKTYGVPVISYEGGQAVSTSGTNYNLQFQAQNDPGMYTLYKNLITQWKQAIGTQYNFYTLTDSYWGLLLLITATGSEKWDAVMSSILPAGDANLDGKVNSADISIVEAHMGQTDAWWEKGDFNHDGVVNAQDLALAAGKPPGDRRGGDVRVARHDHPGQLGGSLRQQRVQHYRQSVQLPRLCRRHHLECGNLCLEQQHDQCLRPPGSDSRHQQPDRRLLV